MSILKIGICQTEILNSVEENLERAALAVAEAADRGADIVVLPEMFVCDFVPEMMRESSEMPGGFIETSLSKMAAENHIWLVGGSYPMIGTLPACDQKQQKADALACEPGGQSVEVFTCDEKENVLYNTCPVFDPEGKLSGRYMKRHLFDVDVPGTVKSCESVVFEPGKEMLIVDMGFVKFGIALCFDIRFPELFKEMAQSGAEIVIVPAAFSAGTGPEHWQILNRARALDSQTFVIGVGVAASEEKRPFNAYGHSCAADPWGRVIAEAGAASEILVFEIDTDRVQDVRRSLPVIDVTMH